MVSDGAANMQPEQFSSELRAHLSPFMPKKPFFWLSSVGAISVTLALGSLPAQAEVELQIDAPTSVDSIMPADPVETSAESLLKPQLNAAPSPESTPPFATPVFESAAPAESSPLPSAPVADSVPPVNAESLVGGSLIDTTDYSLGATTAPDAPSLVFSDRSTGCQFSLQQGQSAPAQSCRNGGALANGQDGSSYATYGSATDDEGAQFSVGPVSVGGNGVTIGNTTVISREYFNDKLRSLNLMRRGNQDFVFPLAIPSPITSLFGWRVHPIFGDRRFHTGTDLGAPEGTPVVATQDGEVHIADYLGGYGLTVILRHAEGSLETRYAHLSRILVRPGEAVQQGEVVGLVGNTGNSTGPHLHFELRELTAQGWIVLNPNELISYAMNNLAEALNNPLLALGISSDDELAEAEGFELPYRPAQPNAN
ncbi:MAG: peptidoglycan DD-metalloendopeptidase family protein [Leptolyngbya sp. SIOISBB]|nr:peptidoglycan DD-metalloendopeptidase family protein [Leptolyngbya sp. SIOISBB]